MAMALKVSLHSQLSLSSCLYSSSVAPCALHSLGEKYGYRQRLFGTTPLRLCHHLALVSSLSRRLFLLSVTGIWDALTGGNSASIAVRRGMQLFRQGDVHGSLVEFDKAIESDPHQKAYLWQRGLSLYHLDRFEEGAEQFWLDVAVNPNDTEELIWRFLCDAQLYGVDEVRKRVLEGQVYDIDLIELISDVVTIPVIASSGAAQLRTSLKVFQRTSAFAALAAGIFHRKKAPILSVKEHLSKQGIQVRM